MHYTKPFIIISYLFANTLINMPGKSEARFSKPIDLPLYLSAGFGEVRPGHFHAGLDIRTNQKEGFAVKSIDKGYITRVAVKTGGYGKVIYINHPGNYMSVYAHLKEFMPELEKYVRQEQYRRKSYVVDITVPSGKFEVKQKEIIGLSGNSGGSGGPHLHFEIRDKHRPYLAINPLKLGYNLNDTIAPVIENIYIYSLGDKACDNLCAKSGQFQVKHIKNNIFTLKEQSMPQVKGRTAFGIQCYDLPNMKSFKTMPYLIELKVDNKVIFEVKFDQASYYTQSMSSSYIDYARYIENKTVVHKSFIDECNTLTNYKHALNKGVLNFTDNKKHKIKYTVKDYFCNSSSVEFEVQSNQAISGPTMKAESNSKVFLCNQENTFKDKNIELKFPKNSFFTRINFEYSSKPAIKTIYPAYSDLHIIHNIHTPLNKSYNLSIRANKPLGNPSKALIVNEKGVSLGGNYENGYIKTNTGNFGTFYITEDTTPPIITPSKINTKGESNDKCISFKISDYLSGIKSFNGYINNRWVLFEYEAKRGIVTYYYDDHFPATSKEKVLKLIVTDNKNNESKYITTIK